MISPREGSSRILFRGLAVLELLAKAPEGLPAQEIADAMDLHRSSIYRYLKVLVDQGYIAKSDEGRFTLGPRILELANLALERSDLRNEAHSDLIELCSLTGGTVHLCRLDEAEVVYVDKIETSRTLPLYSRIGGRAPAYCTGVGKVLLAHLHPEQLDRALTRTEFRRFTESTVTDAERLRDDLAKIVEQGYASDRGEHEEGVYCVAVPIFDLAGEAIASISVTDLKRKVEDNEEFYLRHAMDVASRISRRLGYRKREETE